MCVFTPRIHSVTTTFPSPSVTLSSHTPYVLSTAVNETATLGIAFLAGGVRGQALSLLRCVRCRSSSSSGTVTCNLRPPFLWRRPCSRGWPQFRLHRSSCLCRRSSFPPFEGTVQRDAVIVAPTKPTCRQNIFISHHRLQAAREATTTAEPVVIVVAPGRQLYRHF